MLLLYMAAAVAVSALVIARTNLLLAMNAHAFPPWSHSYVTCSNPFEDRGLVTTMIAGLQLICNA